MIVITNKNTFNNVRWYSEERVVYRDSSGVTCIHDLLKSEHIESVEGQKLDVD